MVNCPNNKGLNNLQSIEDKFSDSSIFDISKGKGEHTLTLKLKKEYHDQLNMELDGYYRLKEEFNRLWNLIYYDHSDCLDMMQLDDKGLAYKIFLKK